MNQTTYLKGDVNNNGKIDNDKEERANIEFNAKDIKDIQSAIIRMKKRINVGGGVSSRQNDYASSAKIAEELTDGKQRVFFNNVGKSVVFKNGMKPLTSCVQIVTNDNSIKNINHIHFENGTTLKGLIDDYTTPVTEQNASQYAPSMNYLLSYVDPSLEVLSGNLTEINEKIHDISYDEEEEETTISHDLKVNGEFKSN